MSRFYRIQIDSIYLTDDGTAAGTPCKLAVGNLEDLLTAVTGEAVPVIGGGQLTQLVPFTKGKQFDVAVKTLTQTVWNSLVALINNKLTADASLTVTGTGETGNFTCAAKPFPQKPFSAQGFINGRIKGAVFRFITV